MSNIAVKVEKLKDDEKLIYASKPSIMREDLEDLEIFNKGKEFLIKKVYVDEELKGYIVFFLGCHGLDSRDISIERIFCPQGFSFNMFMNLVLNDEGFPFPVENIICNDLRIDEQMKEVLTAFGVQFSKSR